MKLVLFAGLVSVAIAVFVAQGAQPSSELGRSGSGTLTSATSPTTPSTESDSAGSRGSQGRTAVASTLPVRAAEPLSQTELAVPPARVVVPSLDLDVDIVSVGVDDEGLFDVPSADEVGWYRYGASPGQEGAAVLAAHVDYNGQAGAFFSLQEMEPGALIHIEYVDGSTQSFEVVDQALYDKTSLPADELFRRTGAPVLHLATCGGTFDPVARSYLGNRVVTAVPLDTVR